jgi:hypothetical protein
LAKVTVAARKLVDSKGPGIIRSIIKDAAHDRNAQLLFLRYLMPRSKVVDAIHIDLPPLNSAADAPLAVAKIAEAVAVGQITPAEAASLAAVVNAFAQSHVAAGLEGRLLAVEQQLRGEVIEGQATPGWTSSDGADVSVAGNA